MLKLSAPLSPLVSPRVTGTALWEADQVARSRQIQVRGWISWIRGQIRELRFCLWAILPTCPKYMQMTIIEWAELLWGEAEGIPFPSLDRIFSVAHDFAKVMHLSVLGSASNALLFSADLFYPQIAPLLTASPFMDLSLRKQCANYVHSWTLSFWQCLSKPKR